MIIWITGNSGAGKTAMARQMQTKGCVLLDGDAIRDIYPAGFSKEQRWQHNVGVAKLAKMLSDQNADVIVTLICPYKKLRDEVQEICGCGFIYLDTPPKNENYPYETEMDKFRFVTSCSPSQG